MAEYTSKLKDNVFIEVEEVAEWLGIDEEKYVVPPEALAAFKVIQDVRYTAKNKGVAGNNISIEYVGGAVAGSEVVTVNSEAITVQIESGVSTAEQIRSAVATNGPASALVFAELEVVDPDTVADVENRTQVVQAATNLEDGQDDVPFPKKDTEIRRRRLERLMNLACDRIESILESNVLAKTFQEDIDGNDSNVLIPSRWPILEVDEIFIDYNRNFTAESILEKINYILRGGADSRQDVSANDLRIVGNSIYLRSDDNDNIIGRIFSGSEAGAIRIKYKSGWSRSIEDTPFDLRQAAVLMVEFYEYKRASRDLGIKSKGVKGESYSRVQDGVPEAVSELLEPYKQYSFGLFERHQNNIMGI